MMLNESNPWTMIVTNVTSLYQNSPNKYDRTRGSITVYANIIPFF